MSADSMPFWQYAAAVGGFVTAFLLFVVVVAPMFGRAMDRALDRRQARAAQELADPILAARRGHRTRLTRGARP